jgi:YggT family protein
MINNALGFLLRTAMELVIFAALLRFFFQLFRVPLKNPLAEFVIALTNFGVRPLRKFVPGLYGMDLSSLALAWLLEIALLVCLALLGLAPISLAGPGGLLSIVLLAFIRLIEISLYMLIIAVFVQAIMSWVSPYNPLAAVLSALTRPFLRPLQRRIPPVGNVDLTPLILFVICQLLIMLPLRWLEGLAHSLG